MLLAMDSTGKAFTMVALAKTMELPAGCLKKAYNDIKKTYAPNTSPMVVTLKKEFSNCKPKVIRRIRMYGSTSWICLR